MARSILFNAGLGVSMDLSRREFLADIKLLLELAPEQANKVIDWFKNEYEFSETGVHKNNFIELSNISEKPGRNLYRVMDTIITQIASEDDKFDDIIEDCLETGYIDPLPSEEQIVRLKDIFKNLSDVIIKTRQGYLDRVALGTATSILRNVSFGSALKFVRENPKIDWKKINLDEYEPKGDRARPIIMSEIVIMTGAADKCITFQMTPELAGQMINKLQCVVKELERMKQITSK